MTLTLPRRAVVDPDELPATVTAAAASSVPAEGALGGPSDPEREWLRKLNWGLFETLVESAFTRDGFEVSPVPQRVSGRADMLLQRREEQYLVQCKHWKAWQVGTTAVAELLELMDDAGCSGGLLITAGKFSPEAVELAQRSGLLLLDGDDVLRMASGAPVLPLADETTSQWALPKGWTAYGAPTCPLCEEPMLYKRVRAGEQAGMRFWGCRHYPECRAIREVGPAYAGLPLERPAPQGAESEPAAELTSAEVVPAERVSAENPATEESEPAQDVAVAVEINSGSIDDGAVQDAPTLMQVPPRAPVPMAALPEVPLPVAPAVVAALPAVPLPAAPVIEPPVIEAVTQEAEPVDAEPADPASLEAESVTEGPTAALPVAPPPAAAPPAAEPLIAPAMEAPVPNGTAVDAGPNGTAVDAGPHGTAVEAGPNGTAVESASSGIPVAPVSAVAPPTPVADGPTPNAPATDVSASLPAPVSIAPAPISPAQELVPPAPIPQVAAVVAPTAAPAMPNPAVGAAVEEAQTPPLIRPDSAAAEPIVETAGQQPLADDAPASSLEWAHPEGPGPEVAEPELILSRRAELGLPKLELPPGTDDSYTVLLAHPTWSDPRDEDEVPSFVPEEHAPYQWPTSADLVDEDRAPISWPESAPELAAEVVAQPEPEAPSRRRHYVMIGAALAVAAVLTIAVAVLIPAVMSAMRLILH